MVQPFLSGLRAAGGSAKARSPWAAAAASLIPRHSKRVPMTLKFHRCPVHPDLPPPVLLPPGPAAVRQQQRAQLLRLALVLWRAPSCNSPVDMGSAAALISIELLLLDG